MSTTSLKVIVSSVLLSQVVTFGGVFAYKGATGNVFPGFGYSQAEMNSVFSAGLQQREAEKNAAVVKSLLQAESMAPETTPNDARIFGDLRARFTLAEFSDLECGFCKRLHPTLREIVEKSNGAVNWQWRHMPLAFHNPAAKQGAHAAECYAEQKGNRGFWAFVGKWFETSQMNGAGVKDINGFADSMGADPEAFKACMDSGKFNERIDKHIAMGEKIGATGTPATVIIDNLTGEKEFVPGAQNSQAFVQVMKRMLQESVDKEAKAQAEAAGEKPKDALDQVMKQVTPQAAEAPAEASPQ